MKLNENRTLYIYVLIYFGFLYIPVMFLPIFSFNQGIHMAFPLQGFSTEHYEDMWNSPKLFDALWNSIYVGVVSSLMATMLAFFARVIIVLKNYISGNFFILAFKNGGKLSGY